MSLKAMSGYVPDEPVLYEKMTGIKFLSLITDIFGVGDGRQSCIEELTEDFEIRDSPGEEISSYSHGMKQKLESSYPLTTISAIYSQGAGIASEAIIYEEMHGRILWHTRYNEYFGENVKMMKRPEFIKELVQHIPPRRMQLIRCYGLYSFRGKGKWGEMEYVLRRARRAGKRST